MITFAYFYDDSHSSLLLYRTLQLEYQYAHLFEVQCFCSVMGSVYGLCNSLDDNGRTLLLQFFYRRLLSKFRIGHGLRVDTGQWENNVHLDRKDRLCLVLVHDQHSKWRPPRTNIIFCLIALRIAPFELVMPMFFRVLVQYLTFF